MFADRIPGPRRPRTQLVSEPSRQLSRKVQTRYLVNPLIGPPQGRLTLVTGTPILQSDQSGKTQLIYTPSEGAYYPRFDGSNWTMEQFPELTLNLAIAGTGYHQSGKVFDAFVDWNAGTKRLVSSPAWTDDTTRADAIVRHAAGFWVNNASMVVRHGANGGDTATIGANLLTYLGTFYATADGQVSMVFLPSPAPGGTNNHLALWNAYNRKPFRAIAREADDSWTYSTATIRKANNSANNRINFVAGLPGCSIQARYQCMSGNNQAGANAYFGVGLDSETAFKDGGIFGFNSTQFAIALPSFFEGPVGDQGKHYVQALERGDTTTTTTWFGDAGAPTLFQGGLQLEIDM